MWNVVLAVAQRRDVERDKRQTEALRKEGWQVLRVREQPLEITSSTDVSVPSRQDMKLTANAVLLKIQEVLDVRIDGLDD